MAKNLKDTIQELANDVRLTSQRANQAHKRADQMINTLRNMERELLKKQQEEAAQQHREEQQKSRPVQQSMAYTSESGFVVREETKQEASKAEAPKAEAPKQEAPKAEAPA